MPINPSPSFNPRSQALLQATQHEADLLAGHLRQAASLGRELEEEGGGLAVQRALGFASTSLRRLKRLQGLLAHVLQGME